jgi:hypothetical protein
MPNTTEDDATKGLAAWIRDHPGVAARIAHSGRPGGWHRGYLTVQTTHEPSGATRTAIYVRDARRKRNQYVRVSPGLRLEVKRGTRFEPWDSGGEPVGL